MLYGFIGAAIAGFLLTAVPSWTSARGFAGTPLILLAALWLIGRLAFAAAAVLPLAIVAVCELAFIPALAGLLAPPLLRARNRNSPLLLVLAAIWLTDVVFLYALMRDDVLLARTTLLVAIDIVLLLVTVIGGRIVPAFTASALRARGLVPDLRTSRWVDGIVIAAMIAVVFVDIIAPWQGLAGAVAAVSRDRACMAIDRMAELADARRTVGVESAFGLCVAAGRTGDEGAISLRQCRMGRALAARADDRCCGSNDPCRHDARLARAHWSASARVATHRLRIHCLIARSSNARVCTTASTGRLSVERHGGRNAMDLRIRHFHRGVHAHSVAASCRWPSGVTQK